MFVRIYSVGLFALSLLAVSVLSPLTAHANDLPYSMRSHYSFPMYDVQLVVYEDDAEWRVMLGEELIVERMGFQIELGDGVVWTNKDIGKSEMGREPANHNILGPATDHTIAFPERDGLKVRQRVIRFRERPYLVFQLAVENVGTEPVTIRRLSPVVAPPGAMPPSSPSMELRTRHLTHHGASVVFDAEALPLMAMFVDPAHEMHSHIAILPEGKAASGVEIIHANDAWHGGAHSYFDPPVTLAPGESLASDKTAVYFDAPDEQRVLLYYAQIFSTLPRVERPGNWPKVWVSAPEGDGMKGVLRAANAWKGAGVGHALIPNDWESRPGSLRTASNRYPNSLQSAVRQLRDAGYGAGITVDPLSVQAKEGAGVGISADGQPWANPSSAEGALLVQQRALALVNAGAAFVAVAPSLIPDEVLQDFNISRGEAEAQALLLVAQASMGLPVFPVAASGGNSLSHPQYEATADLAMEISKSGVAIGPMRVNREELAAAGTRLDMWPGPIEIWGGENNAARDVIRAYLTKK